MTGQKSSSPAEATVFANKILRRMFGLKRYKVTEWRKLHNEELHTTYCSSITVRLIR
jgi:hypothetical protein